MFVLLSLCYETYPACDKNIRKLSEAREACKGFGIDVVRAGLNVDEIYDPRKIARHKASCVFEAAEKPVVVTDALWTIPCITWLPGRVHESRPAMICNRGLLNPTSDKPDWYGWSVRYSGGWPAGHHI